MTYEELSKVNATLETVDVKGKNYVDVAQRIKAFRQLFPNGSIETDIISLSDGVVTMKTTVRDEDGELLASGMAQEKESSSYINKTSFIENCETSAVGRALGMLGIGNASLCSLEELVNAVNGQKQTAFTADDLVALARKEGRDVDKMIAFAERKYGAPFKTLPPAALSEMKAMITK